MEAEELWKKVGARPERILRFGRKDNFWQMGDTGPCGPCSEIHYYMGDEPENPEKNRADLVNAEDGDTTMEIWNLVFMQFERNEDGQGGFTLTPLPAPSVDTGAGLERMAAVLQGVSTNYETDLIKPIIDKTAEMAERFYEAETQSGFAMRVVADHARATAFAIADGILPGNEGRNYVLRKIMRRAIYHGREHLGFQNLFFHKVCDFVIELMKDAFPELEVQRDFIGKMVRLEEERFGNTMTVGLRKLQELTELYSYKRFAVVDKEKRKERLGIETPDGYDKPIQVADLANLYDTYGTPIDLIYVKLGELKSLEEDSCRIANLQNEVFRINELDEEQFRTLVEEAIKERQQSSEIGKTKQADKINPIYIALERTSVKSNFHGYDKTQIEDAKVIALVKDDERVDALDVDDEGLIVLDETPFYAEAGGQVGDTGILVRTAYGSGRLNAENSTVENKSDASNSKLQPSATADGSDKAADNALVKVLDTFAPVQGIVLHKSKIEKGTIKVGDTVTATVDVFKRDATRRNHTATHLGSRGFEGSSRNARQTSRFGRRAELSAVRFYALSADLRRGIDGDRGFGQPLYSGKSSGQHERNGYRRSDAFGRGRFVRRKIRLGGSRAFGRRRRIFQRTLRRNARQSDGRHRSVLRLRATKRLRPAFVEYAQSRVLTLSSVSAKTKN